MCPLTWPVLIESYTCGDDWSQIGPSVTVGTFFVHLERPIISPDLITILRQSFNRANLTIQTLNMSCPSNSSSLQYNKAHINAISINYPSGCRSLFFSSTCYGPNRRPSANPLCGPCLSFDSTATHLASSPYMLGLDQI